MALSDERGPGHDRLDSFRELKIVKNIWESHVRVATAVCQVLAERWHRLAASSDPEAMSMWCRSYRTSHQSNDEETVKERHSVAFLAVVLALNPRSSRQDHTVAYLTSGLWAALEIYWSNFQLFCRTQKALSNTFMGNKGMWNIYACHLWKWWYS